MTGTFLSYFIILYYGETGEIIRTLFSFLINIKEKL